MSKQNSTLEKMPYPASYVTRSFSDSETLHDRHSYALQHTTLIHPVASL